MIPSVTNPLYTRLDDLTCVLIAVLLSWDVTPCRLVNSYRRFGGYPLVIVRFKQSEERN